jgi:hypothetical protein
MTEDEDRYLEQLEEWVEEIRDLLAFIGPTTELAYHADDPGSRAWSKEARTRLEKVKQDLHGEAERLSLVGGELPVVPHRCVPKRHRRD